VFRDSVQSVRAAVDDRRKFEIGQQQQLAHRNERPVVVREYDFRLGGIYRHRRRR
jgi:hypothetical protein